jgi:hypothetical protein
VVPSG